MKWLIIILVVLTTVFSQAYGVVEETVILLMEVMYNRDFGNKINDKQKALINETLPKQQQKLRLMTYNMLYNAREAEEKLPLKHRWQQRKSRLLEYLLYVRADIIGSQELQEDQLQELMALIGDQYGCYGEKTRQNEGRTDINAIFFNKNRLELIEAKTVTYKDFHSENAFTCCEFKDKMYGRQFVVLNTKLSWGCPDRRLREALQLNEYSHSFPTDMPVLVLGDFNIYPFIFHQKNIFFDGEYVEEALKGKNLKDAKTKSLFGHFGPLCSINNSRETLEPFAGAELPGFILDHIFVNDRVEVFTHGIDIARVNGEFPSDHFPVVTEVIFSDLD